MLACPQGDCFTVKYGRYAMWTALQSVIMVMIPTPQRWYRIADRMILGMVTRTPPCRFFGGWGGGGGASTGNETVGTKYVPSKGPSLPNSLLI